MQALWRLAYISQSTQPDADLQDIVTSSRQNNKRDGITGMLLAERSRFLQILEGETRKIAACLLRISGDPRHSGLRILASTPTSHLHFVGWSLHLIDLDAPTGRIPGIGIAFEALETASGPDALDRLCLDLAGQLTARPED